MLIAMAKRDAEPGSGYGGKAQIPIQAPPWLKVSAYKRWADWMTRRIGGRSVTRQEYLAAFIAYCVVSKSAEEIDAILAEWVPKIRSDDPPSSPSNPGGGESVRFETRDVDGKTSRRARDRA